MFTTVFQSNVFNVRVCGCITTVLKRLISTETSTFCEMNSKTLILKYYICLFQRISTHSSSLGDVCSSVWTSHMEVQHTEQGDILRMFCKTVIYIPVSVSRCLFGLRLMKAALTRGQRVSWFLLMCRYPDLTLGGSPGKVRVKKKKRRFVFTHTGLLNKLPEQADMCERVLNCMNWWRTAVVVLP